MHKLSLKASVAIVLLAGVTAASAQGGGASMGGAASGAPGNAPGTNSAGTAQSSGARANSNTGMTTGSGRGALDTTGPNDTDAAISAEDKALDHKMKSICKGC